MTTESSFTSNVDIMNRALQHVGTRRIVTAGEDTKEWAECSFVYDKVRRAELRRNVWRFAVRRTVIRPLSTSTMLFTPSTWTAGNYAQGQIVTYQGTIWSQNQLGTNNVTPDESGSGWQTYFGTLFVDLWNSSATILGVTPSPTPPYAYYAGDLVYQPNAAPAYAGGTTYAAGALVLSSGVTYYSKIGSNTGNTPASNPSDWGVVSMFSGTTTYAAGVVVVDTSGIFWVSQIANNLGVTPGLNLVNWQRSTFNTYQVYMSLIDNNSDTPPTANWMAIPGSVALFQLLYPLGTGPTSQSFNRNVYPLPNGYLKQAPQDPKAGSTSFLGAESGRYYDDWVFEGNWMITREAEPIVFRFVADVADVTQFDDMFCEGMGCRIGVEVCETLTQSTAKLQAIGSAYSKFMAEARTVNGIEEGPTEPPVDDYISCRI